jgi:hypothetical protein
MRKYVKNHGIIFGGPQNFVGFSTGPWTGKGWETLVYMNCCRITVGRMSHMCSVIRSYYGDQKDKHNNLQRGERNNSHITEKCDEEKAQKQFLLPLSKATKRASMYAGVSCSEIKKTRQEKKHIRIIV